jgi:hypothetical protein
MGTKKSKVNGLDSAAPIVYEGRKSVTTTQKASSNVLFGSYPEGPQCLIIILHTSHSESWLSDKNVPQIHIARQRL